MLDVTLSVNLVGGREGVGYPENLFRYILYRKRWWPIDLKNFDSEATFLKLCWYIVTQGSLQINVVKELRYT